MPVIRNPGSLNTGHGKVAPDAISPRPSLTGTGLAGSGPNIGEIDETQPHLPGVLAVDSVNAHLDDPKAAHVASAIEHDGFPDLIYSTNVEGALDELIGTVMKRPPMLGEWSPDTTFSGITDWGYLKLRDGGLDNYDGSGFDPTNVVQTSANVYPYLLTTVGPPRDTEFTIPMTDPRSDHQFNSGMDPLAPTEGMGYGRTHIGAFTRDGDAGPAPLPITRSARLYPRPTGTDIETGRPERVPVAVSGTLFPSDRGVLALVHFTPPGILAVKAAFLAQPLISDQTSALSAQGRVVAALLLGNGILGDKCQGTQPCEEDHLCDGDPGGIFGPGEDANGDYDPFAFPGRASGQYGLAEIHNGVNASVDDLQSPWDDLDGDAVTGTSRTATDVIPAPGQVRLGTDPDADGGAVVANGIPILGGTTSFYAVAPTAQNGSLSRAIHGDAIVDGTNFFRYRLPVLKDYSPTTGLKWTPRGEVATGTWETQRFFTQAATSNTAFYEDGVAVGSTWRTAGVYDAFDEDYWVWQIARYRQTFLMPSIELDGDREEPGTYMLVHFKKEADFESFVRDGDFPWDSPAPYEVYGRSVVDSPEDIDNLANAWPAATDPVAGDGPAPLYGYAANPWHIQRNRIFMDPVGTALPAVSSSAFTWASNAVPGTDGVIWVSGVAYFTPRLAAAGLASFAISACDIALAAGFWTSYRTDYGDLAGGSVGPAVVASQNPVMVATAPWGYSDHPTIGGPPSSMDVPANANPAIGIIPDISYQEQWRLEVPFTHLGTNGSGAFDDTNAPLDADTLDLALPSNIDLRGDDDFPSFSRDAVMRAHFRRPLNHIAADSTNLPYTAATGHGQLLTHTNVGTVLMHTTRFDKTNLDGMYGNFVVGATGAPPNTSYVQLFGTLKDYTEKFLDETHRYVMDTTASLNGHGPYTAATIAHLDGPGMGGWAGGPVETPVRIGLAVTVWDEESWLLMEHHLYNVSGPTLTPDALQVAGLPDRNPQINTENTMPFPSTGMLIYPRTNYAVGHFPLMVTHMADPQPDYSGATGARYYKRVFDAAFSNLTSPLDVAGDTEVTFRFDGITIEDLLYAAPGPGGLADSRLAIHIKVPGLTTWMDIGRLDGAGPGKQDPLLDGAGCLVLGDETYTFTDPESGYKGCYIKCHVGPVAALFANPADWSAYTVGSPEDEVPVMVRVSMDALAVDYDLTKRYLTGSFEGAAKPGGESEYVRGLISMSVVHPSDTLETPDAVQAFLALLP